ncbi:hypothetical protein CVT26_011973 [Gymnopilus dilepis]|uniref:Uncharacterized protein n=1 Tax=Gymnopilus dilepis TaxID=231916 RepID=A0A409VYI7_9AGAR|nr:hypothetical protein CVT26_011973 [Gymnopilus dilepis]
MLSSIANLLPSSLHLNPNQELPRPNVNPDTEDEEDGEENNENEQNQRYGYQEAGPQPTKKEKEKEGKMPNETFIFVRPPPSKSNHPLNLQVQLVPPNAKPPSGVVPTSGADATTPTSAHSTASTGSTSDGASLARTNSNRSENSYSRSSYNNSTSSFSSVASSTVSSNTRRTIIPLYNLQAHNVMTNVIVDAGTDAKIAKFQKRGIELIDLAFLEPVEVWGEKDKDKDARRESMRISVDEMGALVTNVSKQGGLLSARSGTFLQPGGSRPVTPSAASSATSLHSHSNLRTASPPQMQEGDVIPVVPVQQPLAPVPPPKRNIFGKLFNKRNSANVPPPEQSERESSPFGNFSLQPAPIASKLLGKRGERAGRGTPTPPPPALEVPSSPASSTSQQATPTQPHTPRPQQDDSPISPTPTVAPSRDSSKEKAHGRNLSITSAITTPFKTTLKNNKNRLSAVINGERPSPSPSSGGNTLTVPNAQGMEERDEGQNLPKSKRDVSPMRSLISNSRSQLSLDAVMAADAASSNGHGHTNGGGSQHTGQAPSTPQQAVYPLMVTQAQAREELTNLKQQQLQLRPPVLGIQPSYVSSTPHQPPHPAGAGAGLASPLVAALSPRLGENPDNLLQGQRALMYVWLVRKWLKRRPSMIGGVPNPFGEQGFLGGLAGKVGKHHQQESSAHGHGQEGSTSNAGTVAAPPPLPYGGVEVRFEWKRAKGKDKKGGSGTKRSRRGRQSTGKEASYAASNGTGGGAESDGEIERSGRRERTRERGERDRTRERDERGDPKERLKSEAKKAKRMSTGSFSTTHSVSEEGKEETASIRERRRRESTTAGGGGADEDEDSDPEDSETPWVCTLKVRKSVAAAPVGAGLTSPGAQPAAVALLHPQVLRVKVGTLSPTPHHPKVVAMLKVPFPLPDVEVERMSVVRRKGFPVSSPRPDSRHGGGASGGGFNPGNPGDARRRAQEQEAEEEEEEREPYNGLTLTAEEIKDIVCSTGLWLVVREGFGGIGRVSRKGDGWRIRA